MRILIERPSDRLNLDIVMSLCRTFQFMGFEVSLWSPSYPVFDIFSEFKPDLFIRKGKGEEKCINCSVVQLSNIRDDLGAFGDPFMYRIAEKNDEILCGEICFIDYDEGEIDQLILSPGRNLRIFSPFTYTNEYYCGSVGQEYYSILASNADSIICTNSQSHANFSLLNKPIQSNYVHVDSDYALEHMSSFLIGDYLKIFDTKKAVNEFKNKIQS